MLSSLELRARYPLIEWNKPMSVSVAGAPAIFVCRYCIAQRGLRAGEVPERGGSRAEIETHIREVHA